jgi:MFS family permease
MADMYGKQDRGKSLAIVTLLPYLGPALGPLVGGLVTQRVHWSWIFWIMSIVDAVVLLLGLTIIRETYTPVLLRHKAAREGRVNAHVGKRLHTRTDLLRPLNILIHRPIIWLISLVSTLSFGVYCLMLASYATRLKSSAACITSQLLSDPPSLAKSVVAFSIAYIAD